MSTPQEQPDGHTKGPWVVGSDDIETGQINVMGDGFYVAGAIAGFPRERQEANARLIAAAPDLLEIAQRILDRGYVSASIEEERGDHADLAAAIVKATGGAA